MKKLGAIVVLLAGLFALSAFFFTATLRYRLVLTAEVDGQPKLGSSVIQVTYVKNNDPISSAEFSAQVRGEAVVLDLGTRGTVFALLKEGVDVHSGAEYIVFRAFGFPGGAFPSPITYGLQQARQLSGQRDLPLTSLPLLVRFLDIDDPNTAEQVDPLDFERSFGPGAKLVHATLEIVSAGIWPMNWIGITGEPITAEINRKLKWLDRLRGGYLNGHFAGGGPRLSDGLSGADFERR